MQLLERHADRSASHNCFAYKVCTDMRSSDDGEPVGGAPMLTAIEAEGLDGVFVLVTRQVLECCKSPCMVLAQLCKRPDIASADILGAPSSALAA